MSVDPSKFSISAQAAIHRIRQEASTPASTITLVVLSHGCIASEFSGSAVKALPGSARAGTSVTSVTSVTSGASGASGASACRPEILPPHIVSTLQMLDSKASGCHMGRCTPPILCTTPGLTLASSQCVDVPKGIENFAKLNWGVVGAVTYVDGRDSRTTQVKEDAQGSQPNNFLYLLHECVRAPLQLFPHLSVDHVSRKMQDIMNTELLADIGTRIDEEIDIKVATLQDLRTKLEAELTKTQSSKGSRSGVAMLEKFEAAVKDVQGSEQLRENLQFGRLFNYTLSSPSSRPCIFNKVFMRTADKDEKYPGPDWNITALSRDGQMLVANIIQRVKQGKTFRTKISKQWPLEWTLRGASWFPEILPTTKDDWDMDMLSLVEEWKKLKIIAEQEAAASAGVPRSGKLKRKPDGKKIYDEFNVSTQDILTFLRDNGIRNVIIVDGSCNVFASQDDILFCDPASLDCVVCKICENPTSRHPHGGGRIRKRHIKKMNNCKKTKRRYQTNTHNNKIRKYSSKR
jgi:hypothetical protein